MFIGLLGRAYYKGKYPNPLPIDKTRLLDHLPGELNERQEKTLLRMFREGLDEIAGVLSAENYQTITDASITTTTRDLSDLIEKGAIVRTGERLYASYRLAEVLAAES